MALKWVSSLKNNNFKALSVTAFKTFKQCRIQRLNFFSDIPDST